VKAVAWFRKAANRGLVDADRAISMCYSEGTGVEQNFALAMEWGRKAADQGDVSRSFWWA
jgi:hypothetical protein